jgi:hypothetical protein
VTVENFESVHYFSMSSKENVNFSCRMSSKNLIKATTFSTRDEGIPIKEAYEGSVL